MKKLLTVILLLAATFNGGLSAVAAQDLASVESAPEITQTAPTTESDQTPSAIDDHQLDENLSESLATEPLEQATPTLDETSSDAPTDPQASEALTEDSLPPTEDTQPPLDLTESSEEPPGEDTESVELLETTDSVEPANPTESTETTFTTFATTTTTLRPDLPLPPYVPILEPREHRTVYFYDDVTGRPFYDRFDYETWGIMDNFVMETLLEFSEIYKDGQYVYRNVCWYEQTLDGGWLDTAVTFDFSRNFEELVEEFVIQEVPFETTIIENPEWLVGEEKIIQAGQPGEQTMFLLYFYTDGELTSTAQRKGNTSEPAVAEIKEVEELAFETQRQAKPNLAKGTERLLQEGIIGQNTTIYKVTYLKGVESARELIETITVAPIP